MFPNLSDGGLWSHACHVSGLASWVLCFCVRLGCAVTVDGGCFPLVSLSSLLFPRILSTLRSSTRSHTPLCTTAVLHQLLVGSPPSTVLRCVSCDGSPLLHGCRWLSLFWSCAVRSALLSPASSRDSFRPWHPGYTIFSVPPSRFCLLLHLCSARQENMTGPHTPVSILEAGLHELCLQGGMNAQVCSSKGFSTS